MSFTPVGGWARGEPRPGFDQQPIEAWAMADAAARAWQVTGDTSWASVVDRCAGWFHGRNDSAIPLFDECTGGGCDGLHAAARNENQGAESTLALIATLQVQMQVGAPAE
jgi:flavin-binding protein dodecin